MPKLGQQRASSPKASIVRGTTRGPSAQPTNPDAIPHAWGRLPTKRVKQLQPHSVLHSVFVKPSGNHGHEVGKSPPKVRSVATATNSAWSILNRYCPQNVRWQSSSSLKPVCLHTSVHASRNPFKNNRDKSDCVQAKLKFAAKNAVPMTQRLFLAVFEPSQQVASNAAIALFPAKKKGGFQNAMRCPDLKKAGLLRRIVTPRFQKKSIPMSQIAL